MAIQRSDIPILTAILRPLVSRLANVVAREIVRFVDDGPKLQLLQISGLRVETDSEELHEEAEHFQPYGFYAVPLAGAEAVAVYPNGDRAHSLVLAVADRRYRPTGGAGGEVGLYTDEGDQVRLGRGHVMVLSTSGQLKLGSAAAAEGAVKGTSRNTAEQTFLNALTAFATAIVPVSGVDLTAKTTFLAAISAFASAAAGAVSTKVKLE